MQLIYDAIFNDHFIANKLLGSLVNNFETELMFDV